MRAISLSNEPLVISYALRQLIASGELGVVSSGDKAAVLLPMEKYNALMGVLRWLETPARRTAKGRARKPMARRDEPAGAPQRGSRKTLERDQISDLLSVLEG